MAPRLKAGLLVSALIRRVAQAGGSAMVLARGDEDAGGVVVICAERGEIIRLIELGRDFADRLVWREIGEQTVKDSQKTAEYVERRRAVDRDLWLVELDIADAERFAAGLIQDD